MFISLLRRIGCAPVILCLIVFTSFPVAVAQAGEPPAQSSGQLSLDDAIDIALRGSPRLLAFRSGIAAAAGERQQAEAWTNPSLSIEAENIAGSGPYKSFNSAEFTYSLSQEFPIGGKVEARERVADKGLDIARLDYQSTALDLVRDVTVAYVSSVAARESFELAGEEEKLARQVLTSVMRRVDAAASPLIQKSRAEVELSSALIKKETAARELEITTATLSALSGTEIPVRSLDARSLGAISTGPQIDPDEISGASPDIVKLEATISQNRARFDLEKANAIPDPNIFAGFRNFREGRDNAFVAGVTFPIPVFDSNRGNIEKARNEVTRSEFEGRQAALTLQANMRRAHQQMEGAYQRAGLLHESVLPAARKALALARSGYERGRFQYLEVLDAQRSLFSVEEQRIEALREFHIARAQVERLAAIHLNKIQDRENSHVE